MILQVLGLDGPMVVRAARVVVLMDDGITPVAAAVQHPGGAVEVEQAADRHGRPNPALGRMLEAQGMDRAIVAGRPLLKPLSDFAFDRRVGPAGSP